MIKYWPIYPAQLLTGREGCCPRCQHEHASLEKCAHCGSMTKDFAQGGLMGLHINLKKLPVALFERVHCSEEAVLKNCKHESGQPIAGKGYHEFNGQLYHIIDCPSIDLEMSTPCYKQRKKDQGFNAACTQRDLALVHRMYDGTCELEHVIVRRDGKPDGKLFYCAAPCKASAQVLNNHGRVLTEVLIPLYVDGNPQEIMGVLMFGQLIIGGDENNLSEEEKARHFTSVPDALNKHAEKIWEFLHRMGARTDIHRMDYLFAKLEDLLRTFDGYSKNGEAEIVEAIKKISEEVCASFDVKRCFLFLPQQPKDGVKREFLTGYDVLTKTDDDKVKLYPADLCNVQEGEEDDDYQTFLPDGCLQGVTYVAKTCNFYYHFNRSYKDGLAVFVEWNKMSKAPRKRQAILFKALLSACYSCLIAQVAEQRQANIDTFSAATRHDLAQHIGNLEQRNNKFVGIAQAVGRLVRDHANPRIRSLYNDVNGYLQAMVGLHSALTLLRRTLDSPDMLEELKPEAFLPHSRFLHGYQQQYNFLPVNSFKGKQIWLANQEPDDPELVADEAMVSRIASNLLNNADKYAYDGSNIYVECFYDIRKQYEKYSEDCYVLRVTNFGEGIPEDRKDEIFQWGKSFANAGHGGFGLATSTNYALKHGGVIFLEAGVIGEHDPVSAYHLPTLLKALIAYGQDERKWPARLQEAFVEQKRLFSNPCSITAARFGRGDLLAEMRSPKAVDYFKGRVVTEDEIEIMCDSDPTYRITFTVIIPQQRI